MAPLTAFEIAALGPAVQGLSGSQRTAQPGRDARESAVALSATFEARPLASLQTDEQHSRLSAWTNPVFVPGQSEADRPRRRMSAGRTRRCATTSTHSPSPSLPDGDRPRPPSRSRSRSTARATPSSGLSWSSAGWPRRPTRGRAEQTPTRPRQSAGHPWAGVGWDMRTASVDRLASTPRASRQYVCSPTSASESLPPWGRPTNPLSLRRAYEAPTTNDKGPQFRNSNCASWVMPPPSPRSRLTVWHVPV
jgi:hypothetical protein